MHILPFTETQRPTTVLEKQKKRKTFKYAKKELIQMPSDSNGSIDRLFECLIVCSYMFAYTFCNYYYYQEQSNMPVQFTDPVQNAEINDQFILRAPLSHKNKRKIGFTQDSLDF